MCTHAFYCQGSILITLWRKFIMWTKLLAKLSCQYNLFLAFGSTKVIDVEILLINNYHFNKCVQIVD